MAEVPDGLDRAAISKAMKAVQPDVDACGKAQPDAKGTIKVTVKVTREGTSTVTIKRNETPSESLGICVLAAMKKATYDQTKHGGAFTYPFVF